MDQQVHPKRGKDVISSPSFSSNAILNRKVIIAVSLLIVLIFFILPVLRLLALSFTGETGATLSHYSHILSERRTWFVLKNTFFMVLGSTILSITLGVILAGVVTYSDIRAKRFIHIFVLLPFIIPSYIVTLSWTQLMSSNGWIANVLQLFPGEIEPLDLYSLEGMIFILGLSHYPLVYLFTVGVLKKIPRELEWASRSSGASRLATLRRVTLPLALPGIAGGGLLAFLANLDNFGIPAFLGIPANIPVLSTAIYQEVVNIGPQAFSRAATLSVLLGGTAVIGTLLQWLFIRKSKQMETPHEDRKPRFSFGRYRVWVEAALWIFLLFISFVPLFSMVSSSLIRTYGLNFSWENMTLNHYKFVLFENDKVQASLANSLILALITAVTALVIGTIIAYLRINRPSSFTRFLEVVISIPYALPGVVLALAMIFAWMEPLPGWNPGIYGSIWILIIAYVTRFMILQVRGSVTAFMQVDRSMEEASHIFGAKGYTKWRKIMTPLILPGVLGGAFLVFLTALTELTVSSLLWSSGSETIGLVIFNFEQAGYTTHSTAFSSVVVFLLLIGIGLMIGLQNLWNKKVKNV
ncbi:ABC transporter permease [Alteribacillus bidgolensis]|uniref:Iron(III) transport system permease protein n=1 Tax=Alteribacillus bidgolensis TaxID=930129 RepID=A0A1G8MKZ6_9BACI|nr:iron ABC transporter permease [Alteribacillus bidgolensis]SDI68505.1 iron(III) transport system permease protein [Alteribacillus bidgolensis]